MRLGIFTPYFLGEITTAAIRLAQLARQLGFDVRLLAEDLATNRVHPVWDSEVRSEPRNSYLAWAKGCSHFVWFSPSKRLQQAVRDVSPKARHWSILCWQRLTSREFHWLWDSEKIVATSRHAYYAARDHAVSLGLPTDEQRLTYCLWDSGLPLVVKNGVTEPEMMRFYIPLDGAVMQDLGAEITRLLSSVLSEAPWVKLTLDCSCSPAKDLRRDLTKLQSSFPHRVQLLNRTSLVGQARQFFIHDWTVSLSLRYDTTSLAMRSLACGSPVLAYDVPPVSEVVRNEQHGLLTPCDLGFNWLQAPIASVSVSAMKASLSRAAEDPALLTFCQSSDWGLEAKEQAFVAFWSKEWLGT